MENPVVAKAAAERALYELLKKEIEETKGTSQTSIKIANSSHLSADLEVKWDKENHIHIRW